MHSLFKSANIKIVWEKFRLKRNIFFLLFITWCLLWEYLLWRKTWNNLVGSIKELTESTADVYKYMSRQTYENQFCKVSNFTQAKQSDAQMHIKWRTKAWLCVMFVSFSFFCYLCYCLLCDIQIVFIVKINKKQITREINRCLHKNCE